MIRVYSMGIRNGPAAVAIAAAALAVGALLLAFGLVLLLGLVALGTGIGAGAALLRALTGRGRRPLPYNDLDPSLEVFPIDSTTEPSPRKVTGSQAREPE